MARAPGLFDWIARTGGISANEMFQTFNMGIGFAIVAAPRSVPDILRGLRRSGAPDAFEIGRVRSGRGVRLPAWGLDYSGYCVAGRGDSSPGERTIATHTGPANAPPAMGRGRAASVGMALGAAFGWSTYYLFVLWDTPGTAPSAILLYPFLFGAAAYTAWAFAQGNGRAIATVWRASGAYLRAGLMLAMQLSVLAATYLAGPVGRARCSRSSVTWSLRR